MTSSTCTSMIETQSFAAIVLTVLFYYGLTIYKKIINNVKLIPIPTVGNSDPFTSYIGAYRFQKHAKEMVQEGYYKYHGSVFKVPTLTGWVILVSGHDKIDEIRRAPDDVLSREQADKETRDLDPSFSLQVFEDIVHVIRTPLTRNIEIKFHDVRDEIIAAFSDHIPTTSDEWIKITAYPIVMDIVCRASNRMLVGLPLCRDFDYLQLNKQFSIDVIKGRYILNMFPSVLKPFVAPFLNAAKSVKRGLRHMGPLVKERLEQEARYGKDWPERPNDILTWLFEVSNGMEWTAKEITACVLLINFVAIHTTTMTVTHSLYNLAAHPEYMQPLREEIEAITREQGWSKASIARMTKLDSFVKETMRFAPVGAFLTPRTTMKDFTFSDGTTIPAGNFISLPASCIHTDPDSYADAGTFDGFRFEKMREKEGENSKHSFVSLDPDYLLFSHGRHACPGRFFAANELKTMLAYIVLNYDVNMANGSGRPENMWFGSSSLPNPTAEVLFRKRA